MLDLPDLIARLRDLEVQLESARETWSLSSKQSMALLRYERELADMRAALQGDHARVAELRSEMPGAQLELVPMTKPFSAKRGRR